MEAYSVITSNDTEPIVPSVIPEPCIIGNHYGRSSTKNRNELLRNQNIVLCSHNIPSTEIGNGAFSRLDSIIFGNDLNFRSGNDASMRRWGQRSDFTLRI